MEIDYLEKLKDIIRNSNMSTRPEYYSGRGATLSDLNDKILEKIYQGIEKEFGKKPANNFVKMVDDIKVLSATTFLEELYNLYYNDWSYRKKPKSRQASGISIPKNKNGEYDENSAISGMIGIFSAMSNGGIDQTMQIKGHFLKCHLKNKGKLESHYIIDGYHIYDYYD